MGLLLITAIIITSTWLFNIVVNWLLRRLLLWLWFVFLIIKPPVISQRYPTVHAKRQHQGTGRKVRDHVKGGRVEGRRAFMNIIQIHLWHLILWFAWIIQHHKQSKRRKTERGDLYEQTGQFLRSQLLVLYFVEMALHEWPPKDKDVGEGPEADDPPVY